ncbi:LTA synthase family protein [Cupriavidus sp. AU9028]|uniref:LTA synthase family protein n=1 Tax=Cupriavidus sp. AU9028 TaxID=2871157 RepID=UPI001C944FE8|nr:LTA synthase family protein [Cupriavidus sp. AU9028]MBY4899119.1 LTA synthase family protein [Cupriavidus sp. AU9028]
MKGNVLGGARIDLPATATPGRPAHAELMLALGVAVAVQLGCAHVFTDFLFELGGSIRWTSILASVLPVLVAVLALSFLMRAALAGALVCALTIVLTMANRWKLALTDEPLNWNDLTAVENLSVVVRYIDWRVGLMLLGVALLIALPVYVLGRRFPARNTAVLPRLAALALLLPVLLHPYWDSLVPARYAMKPVLAKFDVWYVPWDWKDDVRRNGLLMHLVHTSRRIVPRVPTAAERDRFQALLTDAPLTDAPQMTRPGKVIVVLCESCWHDERNFQGVFRPLRDQGFAHLRGISPVYGGSTVNASFELLTGLPSENVLWGVIYQEYADLFSSHARAWPRAMRELGYRSIAMHNFQRTFWRRHVIKGKFGFDEYVGLEDLQYDGDEYFPPDSILFDAAYDKLREAGEQPVFMFLTTVHTHGPYQDEDDMGMRDYERRLHATVGTIAEFSRKVRSRFPDALIVVAADHKPALTRYFLANGVFERSDFRRIGDRDEDFVFDDRISPARMGDVPVYVLHADEARLTELARKADARPFYCLSQLIDASYTGTALPAFRHGESICQDNAMPLHQRRASYPEWLYRLSLFDAERT